MSEIFNPVYWRADLVGMEDLAQGLETGETRLGDYDSPNLIRLRDYCQVVVGNINPRTNPDDYRRAMAVLEKVLGELRDREW